MTFLARRETLNNECGEVRTTLTFATNKKCSTTVSYHSSLVSLLGLHMNKRKSRNESTYSKQIGEKHLVIHHLSTLEMRHWECFLPEPGEGSREQGQSHGGERSRGWP